MQTRSRTFNSLQAGRAIAAAMVVLYHCADILGERKYWNHSWQKYLLFGHSGVEFFFVLSGIVIFHAHWADQGHPEALRSYAWKRFRRIYLIYWLVLAAVLPVFQLIPSFGTGVERQSSVIFSSIALVHIFADNTVLTVAWTLYHEVMFYFVFAFIILNRRLGFSLLAIWMSCSVYALILPPTNPVLRVYTSPLHLLFGFGMIVIMILRNRTVVAPYLFAISGTAGFIATCVHENLSGTASPLATICYGFTAALSVLGFMELERCGRLKVPQILVFLGNASYSIYLVHFPALSVMAKLVYPLWLRAKVPLLFPFLLLALGSVALGMLVHLYVEKPLLNLRRMPNKSRDVRLAA